MLYESDRHLTVNPRPWDAGEVSTCLHEIVHDVEASCPPGSYWPAHPEDLIPGDTGPYYSMYLGATGTVWALDYLDRLVPGICHTTRELRLTWAEDLHHRMWEAPLDTPEPSPSWFLGHSASAAVVYRLGGDARFADELFDTITSNIHNPTLELLWAAPGTMVGALHMARLTGEERWEELWRQNATFLLNKLQLCDEAGCRLWKQDLYGRQRHFLGAGHGFAGNVWSLLLGMELLTPEERETLMTTAVETLTHLALVEGDTANWNPQVELPADGKHKILVQWCHGAPGIISSLATLPVGCDPNFDRLLVKGGELTWRAGPLLKGSNLCHGTGGNGMALLKLFMCTGDEMWLHRARSFAMVCVDQCRQAREYYHQGRFSLWTGDPGLAIYLQGCLAGSMAAPLIEVW